MTRGLDPHRVAEVLVELPTGPGRRGSGYRVSDSSVLTAAHVVRDAARVRVRFDADTADEWVTEVTKWSSEATADVALLTIDPPPDRRGVELARFGRVTNATAVEIDLDSSAPPANLRPVSRHADQGA